MMPSTTTGPIWSTGAPGKKTAARGQPFACLSRYFLKPLLIQSALVTPSGGFTVSAG